MIEHIHAFFIAIIILTLTPGLDTALIIRNTSRAGFNGGAITSLGICSGLFVHATLSAIGVSAILAQSAQMFSVIKIIGSLYLVWLGINGLRATIKGTPTLKLSGGEQVQSSRLKYLREGFLSNVLNPKTAVFYLAFLPQFINPHGSVLLQSLAMASIHFGIAMIWQCGVAGALGSAKNLLKNSSFMRWMEGTTGVVLVTLGLVLMFEESPSNIS
ncbi:LysE family translocator [Vibrio profundum]